VLLPVLDDTARPCGGRCELEADDAGLELREQPDEQERPGQRDAEEDRELAVAE
jgi:hypothetical protein